MTYTTLTKNEIINLKDNIDKLRKLEKYIFHISEKFNYKIHNENSLYSTFILYKNKPNISIWTSTIQFITNQPQKDILEDRIKEIEYAFESYFNLNSTPIENFYVEIGEIKTLKEGRYEVERFIPFTSFEVNKQNHSNGVFEEGTVKEHVEIGYDHITKRFTVDTEGEYIEDETLILELRKANPFINEVLSLLETHLV